MFSASSFDPASNFFDSWQRKERKRKKEREGKALALSSVECWSDQLTNDVTLAMGIAHVSEWRYLKNIDASTSIFLRKRQTSDPQHRILSPAAIFCFVVGSFSKRLLEKKSNSREGRKMGNEPLYTYVIIQLLSLTIAKCRRPLRSNWAECRLQIRKFVSQEEFFPPAWKEEGHFFSATVFQSLVANVKKTIRIIEVKVAFLFLLR